MAHAPVALSRRRFLQGVGAGAALTTLGPFVPRLCAAQAGNLDNAAEPRALVVIQLAGGLDAHDVIVPFGNDAYHRLRPTLALRRPSLIGLERGLMLNRACAALELLWKDGRLTILPNAGYPQTSPSHFRSTEIWHTAADAGDVLASGWLGRAVDHLTANALPVGCFYGTPRAPRIFARESVAGISRAGLPSEPLASAAGRWETVLDEVAARAGAARKLELYFVSVPGFDTHFSQAEIHARLLAKVSAALAEFQRRLAERGVAERVLTFGFSEFGRTLAENHQGGTDHGEGGAAFLLGPQVRSGVGAPASVLDFRAIYASILRDWLCVPASEVLPRVIAPLDLLAPSAVG